MSSFTHPIAMTAPLARSVAIAALMSATMLASPFTAARADTAVNAAIQLAQAAAPQNPAAAGATETKGETVEQRIKDLHAALKITPDQDSEMERGSAGYARKCRRHGQANRGKSQNAPEKHDCSGGFEDVSKIRAGAC